MAQHNPSGPRALPEPRPRGIIQPAIWGIVLGAALGLSLAGEAWDHWQVHRARRQVLDAINRMEARQ